MFEASAWSNFLCGRIVNTQDAEQWRTDMHLFVSNVDYIMRLFKSIAF